jgi:hypothetical protein
VPRLLRADPRRLHQRHFLEQQAAGAEQRIERRVQPRAHRGGGRAALEHQRGLARRVRPVARPLSASVQAATWRRAEQAAEQNPALAAISCRDLVADRSGRRCDRHDVHGAIPPLRETSGSRGRWRGPSRGGMPG